MNTTAINRNANRRSSAIRRLVVGLATTVLLSGGVVGVVGVGVADAKPPRRLGDAPCQWCPGQSMYVSKGGPGIQVAWDMNVCHNYFWVDAGQGNVAENVWEGDNPPPPLPPGPPVPYVPFCPVPPWCP